VPGDAAPQPGGGIAERLAAVLAPTAGSARAIGGAERTLAPFGAPAEFAAAGLGKKRLFPGPPRGIAQAQPDEVRGLVGEDAWEFGAGAVERDTTVAEEGSGVNGAAASALGG
jgi:hypothetical protein